jgi:hypothetical protein
VEKKKFETITLVNLEYDKMIHQGDVLQNVEYIEYAHIVDGEIEISKIIFPMVIVLTQDCDATQDYDNRVEYQERIKSGSKEYDNNQYLLSLIVAPIYNLEDVRHGKHLSDLEVRVDGQLTEEKMKCTGVSSSELKTNKLQRYHYFKINIDGKKPEYIIDFKHYFTINVDMAILHKNNKSNYMFQIEKLYRASINQRFSSYLSRVGLPETEIQLEQKC